jgi:hypothetical protein
VRSAKASSRLFVFAFVLGLAAIAAAKPPFLKVLMATYKIKENSKIGQARCLNCHMPPGPPARNFYGRAVQAALFAGNARMVTPEMLKSIESQKGDDGMTYLAKIKGDIPPGQLAPKPFKKPAKGKAKPKKKKGKSLGKKPHAFLPRGTSTAILLMGIAPIGMLVFRRALPPDARSAENS